MLSVPGKRVRLGPLVLATDGSGFVQWGGAEVNTSASAVLSLSGTADES
jgi:hypothetical protein